MRGRVLGVAIAILATLAIVPAAGAVVVRTPSGRLMGVMPKPGVAPAALRGVVTAKSAAPLVDNGTLNYHSGPVLHTSAPYLVFWDPTGTGISAQSRAVFQQYLTDVAAGSEATNVYGVLRQYTDGSGFSSASQTFNPATQVISDTDAYPAQQSPCAAANCVTDTQITAELTHLISIKSLPSGTGANAPIYFVVTPVTEDVCGSGLGCASSTTSGFCAYHSSFTDGSNTVLYSSIPMLPVGTSGKGCQADNTGTVFQSPNGDRADNAVDNLSHENSETITDPLGNGWFDGLSGNEVADECEAYGGTVTPSQGLNPNAYLPTLGGSAASGTLYDQLINGHQYYTQTEWSNGDLAAGGCEAQPTATGTLTPSFTDSGPLPAGTSVSFDPSASSSTAGYSSVTWNFGDGSTPTFTAAAAPSATTHTYAQPGTYTATLTIVDTHGALATATRQIIALAPPTASFTAPGTSPVGTPTAFNAAGSSDPNPSGTISSYSWNFGDGSTDTTSGAAPSHTYASVGSYTITLTVTDQFGLSATVSHTIAVLPTAVLAVTTGHPQTGSAVSFSAAGSRDPGGTIRSYSWTFGDGAAGTGATPTHTYAHAGAYLVTLTITDTSGLQASTSRTVAVIAGPVVKPAKITRITLKHRQLLVTVSGPGTLKLGTKSVKVRRAGTLALTLRLTRAQATRLARSHTLTLTVTVTFVPVSGAKQRRSLRVTLHS